MKRIVVFVIAFSFIVGLFLEIEGKRKYVYAKSKVVRTPDGRLVLERAKNVLIKDDKLFYRIEGLKHGGKLIREDNGKKALTLKDFKIRRKVLKNKKTGNRMEYEIYTHPKTKKSIRLCRLNTEKTIWS